MEHSNFKVNASRAVPRLLLGSALAGFQAGHSEDCIPARYFTVRQGLANGEGRPAVDRLQRRVQMARPGQPGRAAKLGSRGVHLQRESARFVA